MPLGWMDYSGDYPPSYYRQQTSSLTFHSNLAPDNSSGNWDASESFNGTYDQWGNLTIVGSWTEEWNGSFYLPASDSRNHYTASISIDADGCVTGSESGYKDTVSLRERYNTPGAPGCSLADETITKTNTDLSDSCSSTSGPTINWNIERHLALSDEITSADLITLIDSMLPAVTSLPWGAYQNGVVRRFQPESACAYPGSWEDPSVLADELAALQDAAATAATDVITAQNALDEAEDDLADYLAEWNSKHTQWRNESVARCQGEGTLSESEWEELNSFILARNDAQEVKKGAVADARIALEDAQQLKVAADFHVTQKTAQQSSYIPGKYAGYMESADANSGLEVLDTSFWPAYVDKGHAQARVRVELRAPSLGETFEVKVGGLHTLNVTIPAGDYFAYSDPYTYGEAELYATITVKNITPPTP